MTKQIQWMLAAILTTSCINAQAQTKRSDDFRAKYELKEVVVMSRHNIRSPLSSGGAVYQRVTPYKWFAWTSPSSQLSLRGGVLETEMGQFFRKWVVDEGLLPDYRAQNETYMRERGRKRRESQCLSGFREIERGRAKKTKRLHCFNSALHGRGILRAWTRGKFTWCYEGFA